MLPVPSLPTKSESAKSESESSSQPPEVFQRKDVTQQDGADSHVSLHGQGKPMARSPLSFSSLPLPLALEPFRGKWEIMDSAAPSSEQGPAECLFALKESCRLCGVPILGCVCLSVCVHHTDTHTHTHTHTSPFYFSFLLSAYKRSRRNLQLQPS